MNAQFLVLNLLLFLVTASAFRPAQTSLMSIHKQKQIQPPKASTRVFSAITPVILHALHLVLHIQYVYLLSSHITRALEMKGASFPLPLE